MTIADTIRKQIDAMHVANVDAWRLAVKRLAQDDVAPKAADVVQVARYLRIDDPGAALEADRETFAAVAQAEANQALCRRQTAALLEPWQGDIQNLRAMQQAVLAQAAALQTQMDEIEGGFSLGYWIDFANDLRAASPRLYGDDYRLGIQTNDCGGCDEF